MPQNGEKLSQSGKNLHKDIYVNFHRTKLLSPPKVFLSETLFVELPKNLIIGFKGTLALLLLGDMVKHDLRVTSYELRVTSYELKT